ncbi:phosphatidate cytidylyltransferase, partial [Mycobacteroides abscessus]|nr:phosphatidate cytidylyltransferase [Mycobacteroides abscessus]
MGDTDAAPAPGSSPAPPAGAKSRAGRNLPAAIGVGVALAALIIFSLLYQKEIWVGIISVFLGIAMWEVTKRLRQADISVPFIPLFFGGQAMIWLTWPWGTAGSVGAFAATVVVCMIWRLLSQGLGSQPVNYLRDVAITVFVAA